MKTARRLLVLGIAFAHWGAAALPCAPLLQSAPDGQGHGSHADLQGADAAWTAPCACGCDSDPAGAGPTSRVGAALLCEVAALPESPEHAHAAPDAPPAPPEPDLPGDRVPI